MLLIMTHLRSIRTWDTGYLLQYHKNTNILRISAVHWFRIFEPDLIRQRKARSLKRRKFLAAGVNNMLAVSDQLHDKWKHFGLVLHCTGIDPFSGRTRWINVYWTTTQRSLPHITYFKFIKDNGCKYFVLKSLFLTSIKFTHDHSRRQAETSVTFVTLEIIFTWLFQF